MINSKRIKKIGLVIIGISIICYSYFYFTKEFSPKKSKLTPETKINALDTLKEIKPEYEDISGEVMYTLPNKAFLRIAPNSNSKVVDTLRFGAKVYLKQLAHNEEKTDNSTILNGEKQNGYIAVYFTSPKNFAQKPAGFLNEKIIVDEYEFEKFKKNFSLKEFALLESKNKRIILENSYIDGNSYSLTQDAKRAPYVLVNGDFDGDGLSDFCVALDNIKNRNSAVLVFLNNSETKEPYLAFSYVFDDYAKIVKLNKGHLLGISGTVKGLDYDAICAYKDKNNIGVIFYDDTKNKMVTGSVKTNEEQEE
ncbi:hypothetical protein [Flavobacterium sp. 2]|uniref:hypothetical protein n=1 Tax=Flavobacterium sp. 2 TaxID=308053 RepID=UPI000C174D9B|nr:hypothetical protein [Flavobacterium sp. 2]PIF59848.1 hypothetical protein CLU99_3083 [Flavobacterium sp. 2]